MSETVNPDAPTILTIGQIKSVSKKKMINGKLKNAFGDLVSKKQLEMIELAKKEAEDRRILQEAADWRSKHWGSMEQFLDLPEVDDTKLNQQKQYVLENKEFKQQF